MKKTALALLLPICTLACASSLALTTSAAVGDVVGKVYETDIKTYIFDQPINAYNIGGQTVVVVEELIMFENAVDSGSGLKYKNRFDVQWNGAARTLTISDEAFAKSNQTLVSSFSNPSYPDGYFSRPLPNAIYETDIKTYFVNGGNKTELRSFNIGGQTCIIVEDLLNLGYDVQWDGAARTLKVYHRLSGNPTVTPPSTPSNPGTGSDIGAVGGQLTGGYLPDRTYTINVNGTQTNIKAIVHKDQALFKLDDIVNLTGLEYTVSGKAILFDTRSADPFSYKRTNVPLTSEQLTMDTLTQLDLDPYVTDGKILGNALVEENEQFITMQMGTYPVKPITYNGEVYMSGEYLHDIIKYHEPTVTAVDNTAKKYAPYFTELCRVYDMISADSNELDCDLSSSISVSYGSQKVRYVKVEDEWLNWLGIETVSDLAMYAEIFFAPDLVERKIYGSDDSIPQFIDSNGSIWKLYVENNNADSYQPAIRLETANQNKNSITLRATATINGESQSVLVKFSTSQGCTQFPRFMD